MGYPAARDSDELAPAIRGLDRWAAWLGSTVAGASLILVALADLGWFRAPLVFVGIVLAATVSALWWRPPRPAFRNVDWRRVLLAAAILGVGAALIAPGSENIAGPRDQAVYVATGFAIAEDGRTTILDPALRLLSDHVEGAMINAWLYENQVNHARIRFPAQLFVHDLGRGEVEGGFLPVVPVWIATASMLGGLEPALHVAGAFGILALGYVMLASAAAANGAPGGPAPRWPLVGAILAVSFSQVWWAREPMAESALGAFAWLTAWSCARWATGAGPRFAGLAALATVAALFTRADAILLAVALVLLTLLIPLPGRRSVVAILVPGLGAAALHYGLVAPIYMGTTYGAFTLTRALGGLTIIGLTIGVIGTIVWLQRTDRLDRARASLQPGARVVRQAVSVVLAVALCVAALSGLALGSEPETAAGAASPLAWLPGYVPWPMLVLAAIGFGVLGWRGAPQSLWPLLLVGGIPALFYLPDPLVTGDHPWMVRRLAPTVIPLLAIAASIGADALWHTASRDRLRAGQAAGPGAAALLVGLGLALALAMDRNLFGPRHGAGAVSGIAELAAGLPPNALVVFPAGEAGIHLAMPLDMISGVDAFAIPQPTLSPLLVPTLQQLEASGRATYWAADGAALPDLPAEIAATPVRTVRIRYPVADHGPVPPPLRLGLVDDVVTLYRLSYAAP